MALVRDLWLPNSLDTMTGPIWPSIEAEDFELRPGLIALVLQNQFRGLPAEDPHEHIRQVLEYASTVQYHGVSHDAVKCMLFTFSLRDGAKEWYYSLPSRFYTWSEISCAFLARYFPLYKQAEIRDQILSFAQDGSENLFAAWEMYKYLLRKCPNHGQEDWLVLQTFYRGLTRASRDIIDMSAGGAITNKSVADAFSLIESIALHQMHWAHDKSGSNENVSSYVQVEAVSAVHEQKAYMAPNFQNHQIPLCGQQQLGIAPDPLLSKNELISIIFDDDYDLVQDDAIIVDQLNNMKADLTPHVDAIVLKESKLQEVTKVEAVVFDADLREQDGEKFTCATQLFEWWNSTVSTIVNSCAAAASQLFDRKKLSIQAMASISVIVEVDTPRQDGALIHTTQPDHLSESPQFETIPVYSEVIDSGIATEFQEQVSDSPRSEMPKLESDLYELTFQCLEKLPCVTERHDWWMSPERLLEANGSPREDLESDKDTWEASHIEDADGDEIQVDMPMVTHDPCVVTGIPKPIHDMLPFENSSFPLHSTSPPLEGELRYNPPMLKKPYPSKRIANNLNVKTCNSHKMVYPYKVSCCMNVIAGVCPITCIFCFFECTFRITLVFCPLDWNKDRVDIPWDPGGFMAC